MKFVEIHLLFKNSFGSIVFGRFLNPIELPPCPWQTKTTTAMTNVRASGANQTTLRMGTSFGLTAKRGVTERPMALPRIIDSVIPPLAIADSFRGNHSRVTY